MHKNMKMFIFALVLMGLLVMLLIVNSVVVSNMLQNLQDKISKLPGADAITGSAEEMILIDELESAWKNSYFLISLTVGHDDLDKVDEELAALRCALQSMDREDYRLSHMLLEMRLRHIQDLTSTCLNNII